MHIAGLSSFILYLILTPIKKKYFLKVFGCVRFLYNKMLSDKKDYYEKNKQSLITYPSKYKEEFPLLKEVDSLALCNAQFDLNSAYNNFFREIKKGNRIQGFSKSILISFISNHIFYYFIIFYTYRISQIS